MRSSRSFWFAADDICDASAPAADWLLCAICASAFMLFWLFARNVLMLPGLAAAASCNVPKRPPGDAEAAIDCCASFSQLVAVADEILIGDIAMDAGPNLFRRIVC